MEKAKKFKIFIGLFYLIFILLFLSYFFSYFSLEEITSYNFIKNNRDFFFELRKSDLFYLATIFILFTIVWVLAAGFGSPLAIFSGFIFGKWIGTIVLIIGLSIGATLLYTFANFFLREIIKDKFLKKYQNLEAKFKKSEFIYLLIYRLIGGIPFVISNVLPCIFNVKKTNFFFATFIGTIPSIFLICSIGSGLEKIIDQNLETPTFFVLITSPDIYVPLIAFVCFVVITIFLRRLFYKK